MLNTGVFKPTILKPMMLKPLLLVTILAWLPLTPMANAESIELLPSISLQLVNKIVVVIIGMAMIGAIANGG